MRKRTLFRSYLLALSLAGIATAVFPPPRAQATPVPTTAVYAFAQQKVYGMSISGSQQHVSIVGDPKGYSIKQTTAAASDTTPGKVARNGGVDAGVSYLPAPNFNPPVVTAIGNNFVWNTPNSSAANEIVLKQALPTPVTNAKGVNANDIGASLLAYSQKGEGFSRGDAYATIPDQTSIPGGTTNAISPAAWPTVGTPIPSSTLFADPGKGTMSVDSVAEVLLTDVAHNSIASAVSDWVITGKFDVKSDTPNDAWTDVTLSFNLAERMVVYSYEPTLNISTSSNALSFDILDKNNRSVFSEAPLYPLGLNPSTTRHLSSGLAGSLEYNNWTNSITSTYPGSKAVSFTASQLTPGSYTFTIGGRTSAYVSAVPEPGTNCSLALAGAMSVVAYLRRRKESATIA
jgi:hypothetical protein